MQVSSSSSSLLLDPLLIFLFYVSKKSLPLLIIDLYLMTELEGKTLIRAGHILDLPKADNDLLKEPKSRK